MVMRIYYLVNNLERVLKLETIDKCIVSTELEV